LWIVPLLIISTIPNASVQAQRFAIAGRGGTLGLGGDLIVNVLPDLNGRFGAAFFDLSLNPEIDGIEYDFDLNLRTFPLSADWYPFDDSFHITAGIVINDTDTGLDARSNQNIMIGDHIYGAAELGTVRGDVSFNHVAPYIGIGWGNAFGREKRWGFMTDLGVAFIGSPEVSLSASGPIAGDPIFEDDIKQEEQDVEDDLEDFKIYPVLSLSLFFRF